MPPMLVAISGVGIDPLPIKADLFITAPWEVPELPEDVIIVGHSFGAYVALKYAQTHRVGKLILVCPVGIREFTPWGWMWTMFFKSMGVVSCGPSWLCAREHIAHVSSHVEWTLGGPRWVDVIRPKKNRDIVIHGDSDTISPPTEESIVVGMGHDFDREILKPYLECFIPRKV